MHRRTSARTSTRVMRASGTERGDQPMGLLEDMPVEPTVALLVRLIALRPLAVLALLLRCIPVIRPSPLALVRAPMLLLLHHMPQPLPSRMNGTLRLARIDAAICA